MSLLLLLRPKVAMATDGVGRAPRIVQATAFASRAVEVGDRAPRITEARDRAPRIVQAD